MYIVALAWIYVVLMMSLAETSAVAGVMTFLLYGVVPVTIILYVGGTQRRKRRRFQEELRRRETARQDQAQTEEQA